MEPVSVFLFCGPYCLLGPPAVTVCQWTSEIRRMQPFNLSSVAQQLASWVESFVLSSYGCQLFHLEELLVFGSKVVGTAS